MRGRRPGKTISAQQNLDGPRIWDKPGLSGLSGLFGRSVWFIRLVSFNQTNETD